MGRVWLPKMHNAPHFRKSNFRTVTPDRSFQFPATATTEEQESVFACPDSKLFVFYSAAEQHALPMTPQMERFIIFSLSRFVGIVHLQYLGARWEGCSYLRYYEHFISFYISLQISNFLSKVCYFPSGMVLPFQPMTILMMLMLRVTFLYQNSSIDELCSAFFTTPIEVENNFPVFLFSINRAYRLSCLLLAIPQTCTCKDAI